MLHRRFARAAVLFGALAALTGVVLYSLLGRIVELRVSLTFLNVAAILSFCLTVFGLLAVLIGGVAWARRAPIRHSLFSAISAGIFALLLGVLVDINVHGPTGILILVVLAGGIGCVSILLAATTRLVHRG